MLYINRDPPQSYNNHQNNACAKLARWYTDTSAEFFTSLGVAKKHVNFIVM